MPHVAKVESNAVRVGEVGASVHLQGTGGTGTHAEAERLPQPVRNHFFGQAGPRANEAHIPAQHVPELGQFVDTPPAQDSPATGGPRVLHHLVKRERRLASIDFGSLKVGSHPHGAELPDLEEPHVAADPDLPEEDRTRRVEPHDHRYGDEEGGEQDQEERRPDQIEEPLEEERHAPIPKGSERASAHPTRVGPEPRHDRLRPAAIRARRPHLGGDTVDERDGASHFAASSGAAVVGLSSGGYCSMRLAVALEPFSRPSDLAWPSAEASPSRHPDVATASALLGSAPGRAPTGLSIGWRNAGLDRSHPDGIAMRANVEAHRVVAGAVRSGIARPRCTAWVSGLRSSRHDSTVAG